MDKDVTRFPQILKSAYLTDKDEFNEFCVDELHHICDRVLEYRDDESFKEFIFAVLYLLSLRVEQLKMPISDSLLESVFNSIFHLSVTHNFPFYNNYNGCAKLFLESFVIFIK